jgi:hypothetical protein
VLAYEGEIGAYGESERCGDNARLPASIPGAYHHGHAEQSEAAFRDVREQNCGNQRERRAEHSDSVAQDRRAGRRNAE